MTPKEREFTEMIPVYLSKKQLKYVDSKIVIKDMSKMQRGRARAEFVRGALDMLKEYDGTHAENLRLKAANIVLNDQLTRCRDTIRMLEE